MGRSARVPRVHGQSLGCCSSRATPRREGAASRAPWAPSAAFPARAGGDLRRTLGPGNTVAERAHRSTVATPTTVPYTLQELLRCDGRYCGAHFLDTHSVLALGVPRGEAQGDVYKRSLARIVHDRPEVRAIEFAPPPPEKCPMLGFGRDSVTVLVAELMSLVPAPSAGSLWEQ